MIRTITGVGQGNGPMVSLHDGFLGVTEWAGFFPNSDRLALDYHPYLCFNGQSSAPIGTFAAQACSTWGGLMNTSMSAFGLTAAGEFSNAVNDCGTFLNGVNLGNRYDGTYVNEGPWPVVGSCTPWNDWQSYNQTMKTGLMSFVVSSMSALQVCTIQSL
jgi:glucan 1,3-beta-glucosidase